jgi:hypothetical protein
MIDEVFAEVQSRTEPTNLPLANYNGYDEDDLKISINKSNIFSPIRASDKQTVAVFQIINL